MPCVITWTNADTNLWSQSCHIVSHARSEWVKSRHSMMTTFSLNDWSRSSIYWTTLGQCVHKWQSTIPVTLVVCIGNTFLAPGQGTNPFYNEGKLDKLPFFINSLWPSDAILQHRSGSTLPQVMACCLTAPSHYLEQYWRSRWIQYTPPPTSLGGGIIIISEVHYHSHQHIFPRETSAINH